MNYFSQLLQSNEISCVTLILLIVSHLSALIMVSHCMTNIIQVTSSLEIMQKIIIQSKLYMVSTAQEMNQSNYLYLPCINLLQNNGKLYGLN